MNKKGLAQIPLMIGLLIMAVVVPIATRLVQQNQDSRNRATGCSQSGIGQCGANGGCSTGYRCIYGANTFHCSYDPACGGFTPTNTPRPVATSTPRPVATNTPRPVATNTPIPSPTCTRNARCSGSGDTSCCGAGEKCLTTSYGYYCGVPTLPTATPTQVKCNTVNNIQEGCGCAVDIQCSSRVCQNYKCAPLGSCRYLFAGLSEVIGDGQTRCYNTIIGDKLSSMIKCTNGSVSTVGTYYQQNCQGSTLGESLTSAVNRYCSGKSGLQKATVCAAVCSPNLAIPVIGFATAAACNSACMGLTTITCVASAIPTLGPGDCRYLLADLNTVIKNGTSQCFNTIIGNKLSSMIKCTNGSVSTVGTYYQQNCQGSTLGESLTSAVNRYCSGKSGLQKATVCAAVCSPNLAIPVIGFATAAACTSACLGLTTISCVVASIPTKIPTNTPKPTATPTKRPTATPTKRPTATPTKRIIPTSIPCASTGQACTTRSCCTTADVCTDEGLSYPVCIPRNQIPTYIPIPTIDCAKSGQGCSTRPCCEAYLDVCTDEGLSYPRCVPRNQIPTYIPIPTIGNCAKIGESCSQFKGCCGATDKCVSGKCIASVPTGTNPTGIYPTGGPIPTTGGCSGSKPADKCESKTLFINAQCVNKQWDWDEQVCSVAGIKEICSGKNYCCPSTGGAWTTDMTKCPATTPLCTECPKTFSCYLNGNEIRWFATGMPMQDFTKIADSECSKFMAKPIFNGKSKGDANCDGTVDNWDYDLWYKEFFDGNKGATSKKTWNADFTGSSGVCDGKVGIYDYSLWLKYFNQFNIN